MEAAKADNRARSQIVRNRAVGFQKGRRIRGRDAAHAALRRNTEVACVTTGSLDPAQVRL